jgi:DNA-binding LytR/AlgR family response regulator
MFWLLLTQISSDKSLLLHKDLDISLLLHLFINKIKLSRKRILLIEDDLLIADQLMRKLHKWGYEVVAHVGHASAANEAFVQHFPDLLLVDIVLEGSSVDGIEIAERLCQHRPVPVVFLSSLQDDSLLRRANRLANCVFVSKQGGDVALRTNMEWALRTLNSPEVITAADAEQEGISTDTSSFFVKVGSRRVRIGLDEVACLEAGRSTTTIRLISGKQYCSSLQFGDFLERLNNPDQIVRIHRSHAVNLEKVSGLDGRQVCVALQEGDDELKIPIGETYYDSLIGRLNFL